MEDGDAQSSPNQSQGHSAAEFQAQPGQDQPLSSSHASSPQAQTGRFYQPELDCLRFFAFFGVFFFHTCSWDPQYYAARHIPFGGLIASASRAGSFGVDLFFLLSAFLITELLLREKEQQGEIHLRAFYLRRILRIWPLYFLGILIGVLLSLVDPVQHFPFRYVIAFLLLSGNWLVSFSGFPGNVMNPLWSVSFEEQFYLIWPTVVRSVRRVETLWFACGMLLVTAELGRFLLVRYAPSVTIFTNTVARLDPIALGIATALGMRKFRVDLGALTRVGCLTLGILIWLIAGHYFGTSYAFALLGYPAMALGAWLIFLAASGAKFAPRFLAYLGKISYGLYVYHMFALYLLMKLVGHYPHTLRDFVIYCSLGLVLTIAMAALSYRFIETPFLRMKERYAFIKSRNV